MSKKLLVEMAVRSEEEVFEMNPVISLQSSVTQNMEGEDLKNYIYDKISKVAIKEPYIITNKDVGAIICHHCTNRNKKKIALLAIPYVINANLVTAPWRKKTDDKGALKGKDRRPSGMISAPILIDGEKYLCNLTIKTNRNGVIFPYALTLKDSSGNIVEGEKMGDTSNAPDSNDEHSTCGNAHLDKATTSLNTTPPLDGINIAQNIQPDKENNKNNINCSKIMNRNKIRLTESQLHRVIKESVNKILKEDYDLYDFDDEPTVFYAYNDQVYKSDENYFAVKVLVKDEKEMDLMNEMEYYGEMKWFGCEPWSNNPDDADIGVNEFIEIFKKKCLRRKN